MPGRPNAKIRTPDICLLRVAFYGSVQPRRLPLRPASPSRKNTTGALFLPRNTASTSKPESPPRPAVRRKRRRRAAQDEEERAVKAYRPNGANLEREREEGRNIHGRPRPADPPKKPAPSNRRAEEPLHAAASKTFQIMERAAKQDQNADTTGAKTTKYATDEEFASQAAAALKVYHNRKATMYEPLGVEERRTLLLLLTEYNVSAQYACKIFLAMFDNLRADYSDHVSRLQQRLLGEFDGTVDLQVHLLRRALHDNPEEETAINAEIHREFSRVTPSPRKRNHAEIQLTPLAPCGHADGEERYAGHWSKGQQLHLHVMKTRFAFSKDECAALSIAMFKRKAACDRPVCDGFASFLDKKHKEWFGHLVKPLWAAEEDEAIEERHHDHAFVLPDGRTDWNIMERAIAVYADEIGIGVTYPSIEPAEPGRRLEQLDAEPEERRAGYDLQSPWYRSPYFVWEQMGYLRESEEMKQQAGEVGGFMLIDDNDGDGDDLDSPARAAIRPLPSGGSSPQRDEATSPPGKPIARWENKLSGPETQIGHGGETLKHPASEGQGFGVSFDSKTAASRDDSAGEVSSMVRKPNAYAPPSLAFGDDAAFWPEAAAKNGRKRKKRDEDTDADEYVEKVSKPMKRRSKAPTRKAKKVVNKEQKEYQP